MIKPLRDGMHPPSEEEGITPTAQASARRTAAPATTTNPRLWLGLKDPRIVRVSRAFGGKDRHSKVSTVKGLRDRRVRLSVQTAIQLYDLQDRLGLNQPSKVVDWLLNAAQLEIDKLPPLPFPPQNFGHFCSPTAAGESEEHHHHLDPPSHHHQRHPTTTLSIANTSAVEYVEDNGAASLRLGESNNWKPDISRPMIIQHECAADDGHRTTLAALPSSGSAAAMYASFCNMDPPNSGNSGMGLCMSQAEETSHGSYRQQPAGSLSLLPGSQLMFYPSGAMPSIYQPYAHQASQNFFSNSLPAAFHSVVSSDHGFLKAPEFAKPPQK